MRKLLVACCLLLVCTALQAEQNSLPADNNQLVPTMEAEPPSYSDKNKPIALPKKQPGVHPKTQQDTEYSPFNNLLKMFAGLVCVVLVFVVSAWILKRLQLGLPTQQSQMKTLAAMNLSNRERVVLVEVAGVQMALGVAPGSVNLLHTFDEPLSDTSASSKQESFAIKMAQVMSNKK